MESDHGGPEQQLEQLTTRREALRGKLAVPWWWYAGLSLALVAPGLMLALPGDRWFAGQLAGFAVVLCLLWYLQRGRRIRPGPGGGPRSLWQTLAWFAGGAAVAAIMITVAELGAHDWLLIPLGLAVAAVITIVSSRRQRVSLRDEVP